MRTITPAISTDLYEITMAAGYWTNRRSEHAVFELFIRDLPHNRNYLIAAGLEDVLDYLESFHFTDDDIDYLRSVPALAALSPGFFDYLTGMRFTGDVWAMPEGTPLFAAEPVLTVVAPIIEAQIVETALLASVNYPTSVASKAARIVTVAKGRGVVEFGARRAPGTDAALIAARSSYVGGCIGSSNTEAGFRFRVPIFGTMAHSWIMSFDDEVDAFRAYQHVFPGVATLLIDTYDTLEAARKIVHAFRPGEVAAVRLDSGDLHSLAHAVRQTLDAAGFYDTRIFASGDLNEQLVADLVDKGAPIDTFGVGTDLTTVRDAAGLGGVYKLVELRNGERCYKMKLSADKATHPGHKQVWRHVGPDGRYDGDTVTLIDEPPTEPTAIPLHDQVMTHGRRTRAPASLPSIRDRAQNAVAHLPSPLTTLSPAETPYPVRFSERIRGIQAEFRDRYNRSRQLAASR